MSASFQIVVPTIRQQLPGFAEALESIRQSFTLPTELVILDGSAGKPAALNAAVDTLLLESRHEFYVTLDDDVVPATGWQEVAVRAFRDVPDLGCVAPWYGDTPEMLELMGASRIGQEERIGSTRLRTCLKGHHLLGGMLIFPAEVARHVGKLPDRPEKYLIWEDAWRGRRVLAQGKRLGFLMDAHVRLIEYTDPQEYLAEKRLEIESARRDQDRFLSATGIRDPWLIRFRRWAYKIRTRS
ncbi:MAG: hypothetical protein JNM85_04715 [Chthonomonas sp.]|nr:hypothetical protein [Chthonomonas sp.]